MRSQKNICQLIGLFIYLTVVTVWYFILAQDELKSAPYRTLQQKAILTEVEPFNEPYANLCLFTVADYAAFVDTLDLLGLQYDVVNQRPTREQLLARLRQR